jgi:hypothetical protein
MIGEPNLNAVLGGEIAFHRAINNAQLDHAAQPLRHILVSSRHFVAVTA